MTPQQALQVIERVRLAFNASGADADVIREAVIALTSLVKSNSVKDE